ncbi:hypothetical protein, partial [Yersinia pestis]|uniref:hypothetical protein n=1 Tax=Yersinia pestis TaxID=632 RepID=UPI001C4BCFCD
TANCFNKSKGVFITDPKLKALLNPQPSWGFSGHKKAHPKMGQKFPRQQPFIFQVVGVLAAFARHLPTP